MRKSGFLLTSATSVVAIAALSPTAIATTGNVGAQVEEVTNSQDIIVTARRRDERLQDVPTAITAIGSAELNRYASSTVTDISARVPSLVIGGTSGPGGSNINLRGVGAAGTNPTVDQAVSLNIDGIQLSQANAVTIGILDLDRVEVLKGPQAMFYGKNSIGGIISLISADPGKELEWRVRGGYEFEADRKQVEAMISTPLTDTLGLRIVGSVADQEGYYHNRVNAVPGGQPATSSRADDQNEYFVRGTLAFKAPSGTFDAKLKVAYASTDRKNGLGSSFQLFNCPTGVPQGTFGATGGVNDCLADRNVVDPRISAAAASLAPRYLGNGTPFFRQKQLFASLNIDAQLADWLKATSVTGYYNYAEDWSVNYSGTEVQTVVTGARLRDQQFTQELRLQTSLGKRINFLVGGYYQNAVKRFDAPLVFDGAVTGFTGPALIADDRFRQKTYAYSFFGQTVLTVTDQIEMTAGGRYSVETKYFDGVRYPSALTLFAPNPIPFQFTSPRVSFNNFSPEVTARYSPAENVTVYAAYREGFTSGGYNAAPGAFSSFGPNIADYRPATARGGEIGVKGTLADRQISFDFTVYNYDYKNLQLPIFDPATISLNIRNAGASRVRGAEFSGSFHPRNLKALTLRSSIAYNDGKYTDYRGTACYAGQSIAQGCNGTPIADPVNGSRFTTQDLTGTRLERAPKWNLSFGATVDTEVTDSMKLMVGGDANYTGSFISMPEHDPRSVQSSAWRLNATIGVRSSNDGWELALIGKNFTNEQRIVSAFAFPLSGGTAGLVAPGLGADLAGSLSEPRTVMLQLTLRNSLLR